ncbi:hypothetical protein ACWEKR_34700 [Nocardia sp. NPDC004573]
MFELTEFYALHTGLAPCIGVEPDGSVVYTELKPHSLGNLRIRTGRVAIGGPSSLGSDLDASTWGEQLYRQTPIFSPIPVGAHEVWLTLTAPRVSRTGSPAYLSIVFDDSAAETIEPWISEGGASSDGHPADSFAYVNETFLAVMDAAAVSGYRNIVTTADSGLLLPQTAATIIPCADSGDSAIVCRSEKGVYPVVATRNARREINGLHVDFAIVGPHDRKNWWKARHTHGVSQNPR